MLFFSTKKLFQIAKLIWCTFQRLPTFEIPRRWTAGMAAQQRKEVLKVMAWFVINDDDNPGVPASYSPAPTPIPECGGEQQVCRINASASGASPVITTALLIEMVQALNTHTETPNVKLKG